MPKLRIQAGAEIFVPNEEEMRGAVKQALIEDERQRQHLRGIKWLRAPLVYATPAGSAVQGGAAHGSVSGPEQGYAWSITKLWVTGLTEASTPDIINIYYGDQLNNTTYLWQLNGNSNAATFGKGQMVILGGETLNFANVGTFNATGTIILGASVWEVPQERLGVLA
jgi:hypothetical protein